MKKLSCRVGSLVLAIAMLISFIPSAAFASDGYSDYKIVYDFKGYGNSSTAYVSTIDSMDKTNGLWAYHSRTAANTKTDTLRSYGLYFNHTAVDHWTALKIYVPVKGKYDITQTYKNQANAAKGGMYILPADTGDIQQALATATPIMTVNYNDAVGVVESASPWDCPAADYYLLVFKVEEKVTDHRMYPGQIILNPEKTKTALQSITAKDIDVFEGAKKSPEIEKAYFSDGNPVNDLSDITLKATKSSDTSIVEVNADGTVTAKGSVGSSATVTVTGTLDGVSVEDEITVSILPGLGEIVVDCDDNKIAAKVYDSTGAPISSDKTAITYGIEVTDGDNSVSVDENTGEILPGSEDSVITVSATVNYGGLERTAYKAGVQITGIPYSPYTLTYDFMKADVEDSTPLKYITMADTKGSWGYHSTSNVPLDTDQRFAKSYGLYLKSKNEWVALKLYVPAPGRYSATFIPSGKNTGSECEAFILPGNTANIGDAIIDAEPVGEFSFYADGENVVTLAPVALEGVVFDEAGEYIFVLKNLGTANFMYPTRLIFSGSSETPALQSIFADDIELREGETATASVREAYLSDGDEAQGYTVTYKSEDTSVATVDEQTGLVTAVSEGNADITVTATLNGVSVKKTLRVRVLFEGASGYKVKYDLASAQNFEETTYKETYNFWKYNSNSSIKIKVPVAGKYQISLGNDSGTVYIGTTEANAEEITDGAYYFPSAGEYVVVFENIAGGKSHPDVLELNGGPHTAIMGAKVSFDGYFASADKGIMSDGSECALDNAVIKYSIADFTVAAIDGTTGKILEGEGGNTTVYADVTLDGLSARGEVDVNVAGGKRDASGVTTLYDFTSATDAWKTAENAYTAYESYATWNINNITKAYTYDSWEWYEGNKSNQYALVSTAATSGGVQLRMAANGWVAFRIKVPAAGRYWASTTGGKHKRDELGIAEIYFLENDANVGESLTPATLSGEANYYIDHTVTAYRQHTDELGAVYFPRAGDYLVVFKDKGGAKRFLPRLLTLDGQNKVRYIDFRVDDTDIEVGESTDIHYSARLLDGTIPNNEDVSFVVESDNEEVLEFSDGKLLGVGDGTANVTVMAVEGDHSVSKTVQITVTNTSGIKGLLVEADSESDYVGKSIELSAKLLYNKGNPKRLDNKDITYTVLEGAAHISESGSITADSAGTVTISASYMDGLYTDEISVVFKESTLKEGPTYYTFDRREAAKDNISKYSWARKEAQSVKTTADTIISNFDKWYDAIVCQGLTRSYIVGLKEDPYYKYCRYCGENVAEKYAAATGGNSYELDINNPWKAGCYACKRNFPSNDFESFYKLGFEKGKFDYERALDKHHKLVRHGSADATCTCTAPAVKWSDEWYDYYGYGDIRGYLYNKAYSELYTEGEELNGIDPFYYNADLNGDGNPDRAEVEIDGLRWGVDDSTGYRTERTFDNNVPEVHTYISYYIYETMSDVMRSIRSLATAYVYTDDAKYGRAGAILLDRIVDFYPEYTTNADWYYTHSEDGENGVFATGGGGGDDGKIWGRISDTGFVPEFVRAADAFYPLLMKEDSQLIAELSKRAVEFELENPKDSAELIWQNWADNLIRQIFIDCKNADIYGNYGMQQGALATAALVLGDEPDRSEMIEWIFKPGAYITDEDKESWCTGGNLNAQLADVIDRDGMGDESSPSYNAGWVLYLIDCAEALAMYSNDEEYNIFKNPKFAKMFTSGIPLTMTDSHTAQIGDWSSPAALEYAVVMNTLITGFKNIEDESMKNLLAEELYRRNGNTVEGLHYDIFEETPEKIQDEILECMDDDTSLPSEMMTGYGLAVLRDGIKLGDKNTPSYTNNMRDFWLSFTTNERSHAHQDALTLGIEAYGINMAPDYGYPERSGYDLNRYQWVRPTISHNTVTVNTKPQLSGKGAQGAAKHFDDSGEVKVMDVDAAGVYEETSIYRRTVVMVQASPEVSYGVDFFRIKGGNDHIYSFHSQSNSVTTDGLDNIVEQPMQWIDGKLCGTYAGANVAYGADPSGQYKTELLTYPAGFTWMKNVRRDTSGVKNFSVDFEITDFNRALKDSSGLHLRMTMLNDSALSEVAITSGYVTKKSNTKNLPDTFEFVLARRTGNNLDTLYTTVYEPYKNNRYIDTMSSVAIETSGNETSNDAAKAVKVVRADGRIDYIVYTTNNKLTYTVTDENGFSFEFRGFVGVVSLDKEGGKVIYRYVNDGDILHTSVDEEADGKYEYKAYTGTVSGFNRDLSFENYIDVKTADAVDESKVLGRYVYVTNDGVQNAVYKIEDVTPIDGGVRLDIDDVSVIRSYKNPEDESQGFVYNIGKGQTVTIPISNIENNGLEFSEVSDLTATVGNSVAVNLAQYRTDTNGEGVTYSATSGKDIPRGASLNSTTGKVTWKPDDSQIGNHSFNVKVRDESGRETAINFVVTVYGGTTGSEDDTSGGGGGGGGGGAPLPDEGEPGEDNTDTEQGEDNTGETGEDTENGETGTEDGDAGDGSTRFVDLGNHAWAAEAINSLADEGVIKGTSENEYSPANNITRADYAILLVRAFKQTSENTENFDDVLDTDYFAHELAIARNTGIVAGIGDNKFAPRNRIMRQDMMLMTYRALKALGIELTAGEIEAPDLADVDEYALHAVRALISNGLVNGKNGYIDPHAYTTRAEVAVLLKRILDFTNKK